MTALTIKFDPNDFGLQAWHVDENDIITIALPAGNSVYEGKEVQFPNPSDPQNMVRNVQPAISDPDGNNLRVVQATICDFEYIKESIPHLTPLV